MLDWIDEPELIARCTMLLEHACNKSVAAVDGIAGNQSAEGTDRMDDFFNFNTTAGTSTEAHLNFLNDKDRELSVLVRHPEVKSHLFVTIRLCHQVLL